MSIPLYARFLDKAHAAIISAIEIYNKPQFAYRDECFALLAINAWELLLKARMIQLMRNNPRAIFVYEKRQTKSGTISRKKYIKKNRSGNAMTLGLSGIITELEKMPSSELPRNVFRNLEALIEIRDNATHFINMSPLLSQQIMEISSATIKNFVLLTKQWFGRDFSESLSLFLPLCFIADHRELDAVLVGANEGRLLSYLQRTASQNTTDKNDNFDIAVRVEVKLARSKLDGASKFVISNDPDAIKVAMTEEQIRERYPWDYNELRERLNSRYTDFCANHEFHDLRKSVMNETRFVKTRYLDPANPKGVKKVFYSANILQIFDRRYKQK